MKASTITQPFGAARLLRSVLFPMFVAGASLTVAVVGALLVRDATGIDGVNTFVETLSGRSAGGLGFLAPMGFAFAAGAAAAFNPCGFAMLPAYMGLYLGTGETDSARVPVRQLVRGLLVRLTRAPVVVGAVAGGFWFSFRVAPQLGGPLEVAIAVVGVVAAALLLLFVAGAIMPIIRIMRSGELRSRLFTVARELPSRLFTVARQLANALLVGGAVTLGFVVLFGVAGAIIGLGARSLVASILPWLGLTIGAILAIVGSWLLGGESFTRPSRHRRRHAWEIRVRSTSKGTSCSA